MITFPNAKINIGLNITERRVDGYHNLETIFYPIHSCRDVLELLPHHEDELLIIGADIPGHKEDNLIWKALELIRSDYQVAREPVKIIILKKIPMGAGMGGGSADAAFALMLINDFFKLKIDETTLSKYALILGSDVPYFLYNKPAYAKGRGELLTPIQLDLSAYEIKLMHHNIHIATSAAFQGISPKPAPIDLTQISKIAVEDWKYYIKNDFEDTIFPLYPEIAANKQKLYDEGALYASMTGTGSTVYGIFHKKK